MVKSIFCKISVNKLRYEIAVLGTIVYLGILWCSYLHVFIPTRTFFAINKNEAFFPLHTFCLACLLVIYLPICAPSLATWILWGFYLLVIAPAITFSTVLLGVTDCLWIGSLVLGFMIACLLPRFPTVRLPNVRLGLFLVLGIGIIWFFFNAYLIAKYGLTLRWVPLDSVYNIRFAYREISNRLTDYCVNWLGNVLNIFMLTYGLRFRQYWVAVPLAVLSQLNLYGLTGYKSLLLPLLLVPVVLRLSICFLRKLPPYLPLVGIGLLVSLLALGQFRLIFIGFADRIFLAPGVLTNLYYEYFSQNHLLYLSHSILGSAFHIAYPYYKNPDFLVGEIYFKTGTRANANIFADGFANFGYVGVVLIGIGLGILLWLLKCLCKRHDPRVSLALFMTSIITLLNAPFLTSFLTHGIWLTLIILFLAPKTATIERYEKSEPI